MYAENAYTTKFGIPGQQESYGLNDYQQKGNDREAVSC